MICAYISISIQSIHIFAVWKLLKSSTPKYIAKHLDKNPSFPTRKPLLTGAGGRNYAIPGMGPDTLGGCHRGQKRQAVALIFQRPPEEVYILDCLPIHQRRFEKPRSFVYFRGVLQFQSMLDCLSMFFC